MDFGNNFTEVFQPVLDQFFNEMGLNVDGLNLFLHEIWRNTYTKGFFQEIHDHFPHSLSGVVFLTDEQEGDGKFYFYHRHGSEVSKEWIELGFIGERKFVKAERGKVILFPSHMLHGVSQHNLKQPRQTVSFNMKVKI